MFLLADDTGVGKTVTAVIGAKAAAAARAGSRILVVADRPASITVGHWCRTIAGVGDGGLTWCVTTWDRLKKVSGHRWDVVVADEVQMIRHRTTARWKEWVKIAGLGRVTRVPYVIAASATPGQTPLELPYLAPLLAHALDEPKSAWLERFDSSLRDAGLHISRGRYGLQWTDDARERASDLATLRGWLANGEPPAMLARPAAWGPCQVNGMPVTLTPDERAPLRRGLGCVLRGDEPGPQRSERRQGTRRAVEIPTEGRPDPGSCDRRLGRRAGGRGTAGRSVGGVRRHGGRPTPGGPGGSGCSGCLSLRARTIRRRDRAHAVSDRRRAGCRPDDQHVDQPAGRRIPAGRGDGDDGTAGRVFHQARYSGIQGKQITGRTHRDGQRSDWHVLYAERTVEEPVARLMIERYAAAMDTVGGDTSALAEIAELLGADWLPPDALT